MVKLKTYILNYAPLTDRAAWMDSQLKLANFENYEFHTKSYDYSLYNYYHETLATNHGRVTNKDYEARPLTKAELTLLESINRL